MTTTIQLSSKPSGERDEAAILLVKVEAPDSAPVDQVYARFVHLVSEAGLQPHLDRFDPAMAAAVTAAQPLVAQPQPTWGSPPVPAAAAAPPAAGGAPTCQHGVKTMKKGENDRGEWRAWACPARSSDPTRCKFQFIRD